MLQNGAKKVYAVDVGHGQLAWKLRNDTRVVVMEKTNIRYVKPEDIGESIDFASIDVSFISLSKVLPAAYNLLGEHGEIVALIKPQFEAGREQVGSKGIVRDKKVHESVVKKVVTYAENNALEPIGITYSPLKGAKGNIEFLMYIKNANDAQTQYITEDVIAKTVDEAHSELKEFCLPHIPECVLEINTEEGFVKVHIMKGLLD